MVTDGVTEELLGESRSGSRAKRVRAAKRLRRGPYDGAALTQALREEVEAGVTDDNWEVVYHLTLAVAESGHDAAELLRRLSSIPGLPEMNYLAFGDAIVRLTRRGPGDADPLFWCLDTKNPHLADGAFRAAAQLREVYDSDTCERLLGHLQGAEGVEPLHTFRFWPAAAAAGWEGPAVERFLTDCLASTREDVQEAAQLSLMRKYKNWRPL